MWYDSKYTKGNCCISIQLYQWEYNKMWGKKVKIIFKWFQIIGIFPFVYSPPKFCKIKYISENNWNIFPKSILKCSEKSITYYVLFYKNLSFLIIKSRIALWKFYCQNDFLAKRTPVLLFPVNRIPPKILYFQFIWKSNYLKNENYVKHCVS